MAMKNENNSSPKIDGSAKKNSEISESLPKSLISKQKNGPEQDELTNNQVLPNEELVLHPVSGIGQSLIISVSKPKSR